ncbi:hypothetical protein [Devosia sp. Root413D1]|uniref:hypothetical protein n=1 Tax=Devosia sp. Root413D1 TaxID=1736531 RepID=UPI0012E3CD6F|nr:hypothetical protein [Devosia sp. Root413D1]
MAVAADYSIASAIEGHLSLKSTEILPVQSHDPMRHRASQLSVLARRQANETLRPFIGALQSWHVKAARLRAIAGSFYSSNEDKALARLESGALLAEVRRRHTELHAAMKGQPSHSRLDDVDAAFRRLIDQLSTISARDTVSVSGAVPLVTRGVHQQDEQH